MSADPRPLLYVAAFVITALAVWVISILARKGEPWARPRIAATVPPAPNEAEDATPAEKKAH
ncbi:hypothetical protein LVJ94_18550 [Pendulispora rubella]|uniref:Uncharacterized protein n=1 Tax=Pendulispora rubella TaxID=2741070 RepID=A0ABZ2LK64_9BACT